MLAESRSQGEVRMEQREKVLEEVTLAHFFFPLSIRNYVAEKKNLSSSLSNAKRKEIGSQSLAYDHALCRKHRRGAPAG